MGPGSFRFDDFHLDLMERQLRRDGVPLELNARYLDALALLVREAGKLVSKDRFMEEVWRGVPVTDEALTQCIRTLRRQLGDEAGRPRFIETVPKHGYRFIAPVETAGVTPVMAEAAAPAPRRSWQEIALLTGGGTIGGGMAGLFGGLFFGFAATSQPLQPGVGAASVLVVLLCLTIAVAVLGAAGVSFGIAASGFASRGPSPAIIAGGAVGGLVVGAAVKLLGLDAFNLLLGQSPGEITGAPEGSVLGAAVGLGAWLGSRGRTAPPLRRSVGIAGLAGASAGILITLAGGRLMAGSLELLARQFPTSRLRLDRIGSLLGQDGFGPVSHYATAALEGALFASFVVGAMILARRSWSRPPD